MKIETARPDEQEGQQLRQIKPYKLQQEQQKQQQHWGRQRGQQQRPAQRTPPGKFIPSDTGYAISKIKGNLSQVREFIPGQGGMERVGDEGGWT